MASPYVDNLDSSHIISIDGLCKLSSALHNFTLRYKELQEHLDSIQASMEKRSQHLQSIASKVKEELVSQSSLMLENEVKVKLQDDRSVGETTAPTSSDELNSVKDSERKPENFCRNMHGRELRKYVVNHLQDVENIRNDVISAFRSAPNSSKLALNCIGRFYLQGKRAYETSSPMVTGREASILLLEFFLLSDCLEIDPKIKIEADVAALAWKKRIVSEGGIEKSESLDALGLLLLILSFGIPSDFTKDEIISLIKVSKVRNKSDVVQHSTFVSKIADVVQDLSNVGKHVEAVDLICTLGLQEKFPPLPLLSSFVILSKGKRRELNAERKGFSRAEEEACRKELTKLKSVIKCLKDHNLDPSKLGDTKINERIMSLEEKISKLNQDKEKRKPGKKRKFDEGPSKPDNIQGRDCTTVTTRPPIFAERLPQTLPPSLGTVQSIASLPSHPWSSGLQGYHEPCPGKLPNNMDPILSNGRSFATEFGGSEFLRTTGHMSNNIIGQAQEHHQHWPGVSAYSGSKLMGHTRLPPIHGENLGLGFVAPSRMIPFPGEIGSKSTGGSSNLYRFADTVVEKQNYMS